MADVTCCPALDPMPAGIPVQPRSLGRLALTASDRRGRTGLTHLRSEGALKALFPRPTGHALDAITINTGGGITGGDRFWIDATATDTAHLRLTTQACERAYRAQPGEVGRMQTDLTVAAGARLDWLPQETILFDGCALSRRLRLRVADGATALLVEPLIFGRAAMGERPDRAHLTDRIEIWRGDMPLYFDTLRLGPDMTAQIDRPGLLAGAGAIATLILVAPGAAGHLSALRALLPETAGASLIRDDLIAARILAPDSLILRRSLIPVLRHLTDNALPRSWMT